MNNCTIYANCQGLVIKEILEGYPPFSHSYTISYIPNYRYMHEKTELPRNLLENTDLFIYQPIDKKREIYCTHPDYPNGIANILKKSCISISFPYIYNSGIFILFEEGEDINNKSSIMELIQKGLCLREILEKFTKIEIDFNVRQRYEQSMLIMKEKEKDCIIKVSDLIERDIRKRRVFYTQNHVANFITYHVVNEILRMTDLPEIYESSWGNEKMANFIWPLSPYEISALNLSYAHPESGWVETYARMITRIYKGDFKKHKDLYALNLLQV